MDDFSAIRTYAEFQRDFPDWLIQVRDPRELFARQPSYVVSQTYCIVGALLCLGHALLRGGRWPFLWLAATLSGVMIEVCFYFSPFGETIWLSPTVIDLFGQRIPLFICFVYPFFYYQAFWAVSKLHLKCRWSEHIAAGMLVVLFDLPFDMVSIKYLHWTLHETEQMLAERVYSVPSTLLLFFAVATFSFSYFFHNLRMFLDRSQMDRWAVGSIRAELLAAIGAAGISVSLGSSLFLAINYPLHTALGIPNKTIVIATFLCVAAVFWKFDRKSNRRIPSKQTFVDHALNIYIVGHFILYTALALLFSPEDTVSTGRHQPTGDCRLKDAFLCLDAVKKDHFDFHCATKPPSNGAYWYTICGTPFENRAEVLFVLTVVAFIATLVHWTVHYDFDVRFKIYDFVKKPTGTSTKGSALKKSQ